MNLIFMLHLDADEPQLVEDAVMTSEQTQDERTFEGATATPAIQPSVTPAVGKLSY